MVQLFADPGERDRYYEGEGSGYLRGRLAAAIANRVSRIWSSMAHLADAVADGKYGRKDCVDWFSNLAQRRHLELAK